MRRLLPPGHARSGRRPAITPAEPQARWYPLAIVAVTVVVYANSLGNEFVWDDHHLVVENPAIKSWGRFWALWTSDLFPRLVTRYYRPLQTLSYLLDYQLWTLTPFGYHLTNTLLHAGVALLFYRFVAGLLEVPRAALIAALLFTVHPIHTEAVTYIAGRSDPLSALFLLAALVIFARGDRNRFTRWRIASLVAFAAALFAREAAMVLVPLVVLVDVTLSRRDGEPTRGTWGERVLTRYLPYVAVLALYGCARVAAVGLAAVPTALAEVPLSLRLATMLEVIVRYVVLLVVPLGLHMERTVAPATSVLEPRVLGAALLVVGAVAGAVVCRRRAWPVSFGVAWFLIALLPVANIAPLVTFMAEHWLYVPSLGLFLAAGWALDRAMTSWRRTAVAAIVGLALVAYGGLTARRNLDWKREDAFYEATLRYAPASVRVLANLGDVNQRLGRLDRAEAAYRRALAIDPPVRNYNLDLVQATAHNNLGLVLRDLGRVEEAKGQFEAALRLNPSSADAYGNLGNDHFRRGQLAEAVEAYRAAVRLDPGSAKVHNNLGSVYFKMGQLDLADDEIRRALELDPTLGEVRRNLDALLRARANAPSPRPR